MQLANSQLKWLYFFDEGVTDKKLLGGKGAGLCEMTSLRTPDPAGFVITTNVCEEFYRNGQKLPSGLMDSVFAAMTSLEDRTGKKFGNAKEPLLVSVRSGAPVSMPGMMDTILNLGLNDVVVEGLAEPDRRQEVRLRHVPAVHPALRQDRPGRGRRRVLQAPGRREEEAPRLQDSDLDAESIMRVADAYKDLLLREGKPLPQEPAKQLELAIDAVFRSWNGKRAIEYRKQYRITPELAKGPRSR